MAVVIRVNTSHASLAGLSVEAKKKLRFVIGPVGGPMFFPLATPPFSSDMKKIGEPARSRAILEVGSSTPISFNNFDFQFLGNVDDDAFHSVRTKATLIDYMRKGLLIVEKDGVAMTPEAVGIYTP